MNLVASQTVCLSHIDGSRKQPRKQLEAQVALRYAALGCPADLTHQVIKFGSDKVTSFEFV